MHEKPEPRQRGLTKTYYTTHIISDMVPTMCEQCGCWGYGMRRGGGCGCCGPAGATWASRSYLRNTDREDLKDYVEDLRAETQRVERILKERVSEKD